MYCFKLSCDSYLLQLILNRVLGQVEEEEEVKEGEEPKPDVTYL